MLVALITFFRWQLIKQNILQKYIKWYESQTYFIKRTLKQWMLMLSRTIWTFTLSLHKRNATSYVWTFFAAVQLDLKAFLSWMIWLRTKHTAILQYFCPPKHRNNKTPFFANKNQPYNTQILSRSLHKNNTDIYTIYMCYYITNIYYLTHNISPIYKNARIIYILYYDKNIYLKHIYI